MSCFIVPMTQAVITTVVRKNLKDDRKNPWISQLPKLELMLWGGTVMLIIDHIINGELTWQYPFFTSLQPQEMLTIGLPMSLFITLIYCIMVAWVWHKDKISASIG